MTIKQIEKLKKMKIGEIIEIGQVSIKKDRGQYNVTKGRFIKTYREEEFNVMCQKIDSMSSETVAPTRLSYEIPGTRLIVLKTATGYEVYENGKILQKNLSEEELDAFVQLHKQNLEEKKVTKIRKEVAKEYSMTRQKKVLYYFILVLSVMLLAATYIFGIKFEGVSITRTNQDVYDVITVLANEKYPENNMDDFDKVYYTLNYWAHKQNYFMTETYVVEERNSEGIVEDVVKTNLVVLTTSNLYLYYQKNELNMDLGEDKTFSGVEFNALFKDFEGRYVNEIEVIKRIGYILGEPNITSLNELTAAYLRWDEQDNRSNRAYNWEVIAADGSRAFDYTSTYYTTYLSRNNFLKLFISDPSAFVNEYNMFESIGWLSWTSVAILILYLILAFSVWVFKKDNLKISKGLVSLIIILSVLIVVPLILQYFFEGLSKNATEFLDVVENTRFTTTTTTMNFFFDYIIKFSNIILTGILTIALPLKIVRYFVFNAINKLDKDKRIERVIAGGVTLSENMSGPDWRM